MACRLQAGSHEAWEIKRMELEHPLRDRVPRLSSARPTQPTEDQRTDGGWTQLTSRGAPEARDSRYILSGVPP